MTVSELASKPARKRKTKAWVPPTIGDFHYGRVIGIDQSLAGCGVVSLSHMTFGMAVVESVTLKTPQMALGVEDSLQRCVELAKQLRAFLAGYSRSEWAVAHEAPPMIGRPGGKNTRPESSWLAAAALRLVLASSGHELLPMVTADHHKKITCGNGRAEKRDAHAGMLTWATPMVQHIELVTNANERDGLSVALTSLWRHV